MKRKKMIVFGTCGLYAMFLLTAQARAADGFNYDKPGHPCKTTGVIERIFLTIIPVCPLSGEDARSPAPATLETLLKEMPEEEADLIRIDQQKLEIRISHHPSLKYELATIAGVRNSGASLVDFIRREIPGVSDSYIRFSLRHGLFAEQRLRDLVP